jgi:hypothetical protein
MVASLNKAEVMVQLDEQVNRALARLNFWEMCLYYDEEFFTKRSFLRQVAIAFQRIAEGEIGKASVSMPPRAGKSYITSLFCASPHQNRALTSVVVLVPTSSASVPTWPLRMIYTQGLSRHCLPFIPKR